MVPALIRLHFPPELRVQTSSGTISRSQKSLIRITWSTGRRHCSQWNESPCWGNELLPFSFSACRPLQPATGGHKARPAGSQVQAGRQRHLLLYHNELQSAFLYNSTNSPRKPAFAPRCICGQQLCRLCLKILSGKRAALHEILSLLLIQLATLDSLPCF